MSWIKITKAKIEDLTERGFSDVEIQEILNLESNSIVASTTSKYWKNKMVEAYNQKPFVNPASKQIVLNKIVVLKCSKCSVIRQKTELECKICKENHGRKNPTCRSEYDLRQKE